MKSLSFFTKNLKKRTKYSFKLPDSISLYLRCETDIRTTIFDIKLVHFLQF